MNCDLYLLVFVGKWSLILSVCYFRFDIFTCYFVQLLFFYFYKKLKYNVVLLTNKAKSVVPASLLLWQFFCDKLNSSVCRIPEFHTSAVFVQPTSNCHQRFAIFTLGQCARTLPTFANQLCKITVLESISPTFYVWLFRTKVLCSAF